MSYLFSLYHCLCLRYCFVLPEKLYSTVVNVNIDLQTISRYHFKQGPQSGRSFSLEVDPGSVWSSLINFEEIKNTCQKKSRLQVFKKLLEDQKSYKDTIFRALHNVKKNCGKTWDIIRLLCNILICKCMQKHIQHNKDEGTQFFRKIYLLLYSKGFERVTKGVIFERWVGDWTELQHIDPTNSSGYNSISFPFSWAAQPGAQPVLGHGSHSSIFSPTDWLPVAPGLYNYLTSTYFLWRHNSHSIQPVNSQGYTPISSTGCTCYLHRCISSLTARSGRRSICYSLRDKNIFYTTRRLFISVYYFYGNFHFVYHTTTIKWEFNLHFVSLRICLTRTALYRFSHRDQPESLNSNILLHFSIYDFKLDTLKGYNG